MITISIQRTMNIKACCINILTSKPLKIHYHNFATNSDFLIPISLQPYPKYQFCGKSAEIPRNLSQENPVKMSTKFVEILGNFQRKVLKNQFLGISLELFPRFSQEFLRNILKYSQHIPE